MRSAMSWPHGKRLQSTVFAAFHFSGSNTNRIRANGRLQTIKISQVFPFPTRAFREYSIASAIISLLSMHTVRPEYNNSAMRSAGIHENRYSCEFLISCNGNKPFSLWYMNTSDTPEEIHESTLGTLHFLRSKVIHKALSYLLEPHFVGIKDNIS